MKLSELKVGMLVRHPDFAFEYEVLCVGRSSVFVASNGGSEYTLARDGGFSVVEPRKKPSERIREIRCSMPPEMNTSSAQLSAIEQYLDEQASEQK